MSIFDKLTNTPACGKNQTFAFAALPESLAQMQAMPEAALRDQFLLLSIRPPKSADPWA